VLCDRTSGFLVLALIRDDDADLRWQVFARAVKIDSELRASNLDDAAKFNLLADDGSIVGNTVSDGLPTNRSGESGLGRIGSSSGNRVDDDVRKSDELVVLRNEVGLAGEFDQVHRVSGLLGGNEAFARRAVSALGVTLCALESKNLDSLVHVSAGFDESVLGVDHSGPKALTESFDVF
jgi:hypothetical protein